MPEITRPGVYINERAAFTGSVVEVDTAIAAFIGYTGKADNQGINLHNTPWRITSMAEFEQYFGTAPTPMFTIEERPSAFSDMAEFTHDGKDYWIHQAEGKPGGNYLLYYSMKLFYQNGGGTCYVVSIGDYETEIDVNSLRQGIDTLSQERAPTIVVIPDTVLLNESDCIALQQACLAHCGETMKNRVALLDIPKGYRNRQHSDGDCIKNFRSAIGTDFLSYGAAYYPWLNTSIVENGGLGYENIGNTEKLQDMLRSEFGIIQTGQSINGQKIESARKSKIKTSQLSALINSMSNDWSQEDESVGINQRGEINKRLLALSSLLNTILAVCRHRLNLLPPAAAIAGIFTLVDNSRGVWKAPANISLHAVVSPAVNISQIEQEDLNISPSGKSINAIRSFTGQGAVVWGARTLDGNNPDRCYINVRRTLIMLEESIKMACQSYVFEPNDANTWTAMKNMIANFLTLVWKRGGLVGSKPDQAFAVHIGLGQTMTEADILDGILRFTVMVAIVKPAEFMVIRFQQKMQN